MVTIITTGEIYEYSEEDSLSPEGIEAKNKLVINGGIIQVSANDDALNAGSAIEINGGYIFCQSRAADAIDSNGIIKITGGTTIALGSNAPEMGIDCDTAENFSYLGGTLIAISGVDVLPRASPWESGHGNDGCVPKDVLHRLWPARPVRPRLMV